MWKQHHNNSQNSLCVNKRGEDTIWLHSWLLSVCGLYYLKSTMTILVTLSLSLLHAHVHKLCCTDWNTDPLFQTSSPWLHTRSLYTLTTTIFTEIYHSYFYSLWYKTPNIVRLLPLTWPRWGRGHRWLVNDDPQWSTFIHEKKPMVLQFQYMGQDLIPKLKNTAWVLKVSSLISAQLEIMARWCGPASNTEMPLKLKVCN